MLEEAKEWRRHGVEEEGWVWFSTDANAAAPEALEETCAGAGCVCNSVSFGLRRVLCGISVDSRPSWRGWPVDEHDNTWSSLFYHSFLL